MFLTIQSPQFVSLEAEPTTHLNIYLGIFKRKLHSPPPCSLHSIELFAFQGQLAFDILTLEYWL